MTHGNTPSSSPNKRREDYEDQPGLRKRDLDANPIQQFAHWYTEAQQAHSRDSLLPNAMTLATCSPEGAPSARVVLLKAFDERGFVFYTNFESQKGQELEANPCTALVFYWPALGRQVRISGTVSRLAPQENEQYHRSRPRSSQLGALISEQSQIILDRECLENALAELGKRYEGKDIPRPENWGGYCVLPLRVEFWQGQPNRLHDRLIYVKQPDGSWNIQRLAP